MSLLLEQPHFGHVLAQIVDQLIEDILGESFNSISSPQSFLRILSVLGSFEPSLSKTF